MLFMLSNGANNVNLYVHMKMHFS